MVFKLFAAGKWGRYFFIRSEHHFFLISHCSQACPPPPISKSFNSQSAILPYKHLCFGFCLYHMEASHLILESWFFLSDRNDFWVKSLIYLFIANAYISLSKIIIYSNLYPNVDSIAISGYYLTGREYREGQRTQACHECQKAVV